MFLKCHQWALWNNTFLSFFFSFIIMEPSSTFSMSSVSRSTCSVGQQLNFVQSSSLRLRSWSHQATREWAREAETITVKSHKGHGVLNYQQLDRLFSNLFRLAWHKTSKLRITGSCITGSHFEITAKAQKSQIVCTILGECSMRHNIFSGFFGSQVDHQK